jgi:hypothetical protein
MSNTIGSSLPVDIAQLVASGDIQTLIQMVQSDRVKLLDQQLVDQVKAVEARNKQIAKLNDVLTRLNAYATQIEGTDPDDKPKAKDWTNEKIKQYEIPLNDAILAAGITDLGFKSRTGQRTPNKDERQDGSAGKLVTGTNIVTGSTTKSEIDTAITKVKGLIDAESNNQQMDMLRLQSLNNKKNESIEILTNTQKKHTDANTNIIRNI